MKSENLKVCIIRGVNFNKSLKNITKVKILSFKVEKFSGKQYAQVYPRTRPRRPRRGRSRGIAHLFL